jgi:hypothetical protein
MHPIEGTLDLKHCNIDLLNRRGILQEYYHRLPGPLRPFTAVIPVSPTCCNLVQPEQLSSPGTHVGCRRFTQYRSRRSRCYWTRF